MKQIVIGTDGSPSAQEAVEFGIELAQEQGADVTFVHVTPADEFVGGRVGTHAVSHREAVDESETTLKAAAGVAEKAGVSYTLERISGESAETIVGLAESLKADLIVVGSRGRGPVSSALLGSVSRDVLARASGPVLVARTAKTPAGAAH